MTVRVSTLFLTTALIAVCICWFLERRLYKQANTKQQGFVRRYVEASASANTAKAWTECYPGRVSDFDEYIRNELLLSIQFLFEISKNHHGANELQSSFQIASESLQLLGCNEPDDFRNIALESFSPELFPHFFDAADNDFELFEHFLSKALDKTRVSGTVSETDSVKNESKSSE